MDNQNQPNQEQPVSAGQPTPEPNPTPMEANQPVAPLDTPASRNWKKWILVGLGLVILIIGGGTYFLSQQKSQKSATKTVTQPTVAQPSPTSDPTVDWKTYTDTQYNFYFQYPSSLEICTTCGMSGPLTTNLNPLVVIKDPKSGETHFDGFAVYVVSNKNNLSFREYIDREQKINIESSGKSLPETKTSINGINGVELEGPAFGINSISVPFPDNKNFLVISYGSSIKIKQALVDLLQTFKFTELSPSISTQDPKLACEQKEGTWLEEYNECESASGGLDKKTCSELGGTLNECASACRHNPNAQGCVEVCINVCKF